MRIIAWYLLYTASLALWTIPLPQVSDMLPVLRVFQLMLGIQVRWDEVRTIPVYHDSTSRPKSCILPGY